MEGGGCGSWSSSASGASEGTSSGAVDGMDAWIYKESACAFWTLNIDKKHQTANFAELCHDDKDSVSVILQQNVRVLSIDFL